jgi:endonuclease YncB( thermonuclease family)
MTSLLRMLAVILVVPAPTVAASSAAAQQPCPLTAIGTSTVAGVRDGCTVAFADGRLLRLAAVEVPANNGAALQNLVAGRLLRLEKLSADHDRYGRLVASAFAGGSQQSVQRAPLEQGEARVSASVGDRACADALLVAKREPRAGRCGLWFDPNFAPLPAENLARLWAERGHFALVEGKGLVGARERRHYLYEFRAALDEGFQRRDCAALSARLCRGGHRAEAVGRTAHPGARLGRAAPRPGHRG